MVDCGLASPMGLVSRRGGPDFRCSSEDVDATPAIRRHVDVIGGGTGMSRRGTRCPVELKVIQVINGKNNSLR